MRVQSFWRLSAVVLGMACHGVAAVGYFIDEDSCTAPMRDAVEKVLEGTFAMVKAGQANVGKANNNPNGPEQKLIDNMFGKDPDGAPKFSQIKTIITKKLGFIAELDGNRLTSKPSKTQPSNDVVIYCDERRLKVRKSNPTKSFDKDVEEITDSGICAINVAYAGQSKAFSQLQICPKLMQVILNDPTKTTAALPKSFWSKMLSNFVTYSAKIFYTPIDAVQLADKVLLHELTHLPIGGQTDDVGGFFQAYGWKNCRKLSQKRGLDGGDGNADNWALYGSVSLLIQEQSKTAATDSGNIISTDSAAKRAIRAARSAAGRWIEFIA